IMPEIEGNGVSGSTGRGLNTGQLNWLMRPYVNKGYLGAIPSDQVKNLEPRNGDNTFIMNLDTSDGPGSHWVAVFVSPKKDRTVEYYDSYAKGPSKQFMKDIKTFVEKMSPETYLKFKVNKIKHQSRSSKRCGYHSCLFLMDRYKGIDFK